MKTIQTKPDTTLMFGEIPDGVSIEKITEMIGIFGQVLGKLSEITEEQARELVDVDQDSYEVLYFQTFTNKNGDKYGWLNALSSLKDAALSVGIKEEDFDKYLVVKL